ARSIANAIRRTWISRWGAPLSFHSDCGHNFESQLFHDVCEILSVQKTHTTPYHPEGNGLVERTNRTINNLLLAFCEDNHRHDWDLHLPLCLMAYRASTHSSTGFTPHYLWTGCDLRLPVDLSFPLPSPTDTTVHDFATHLRETTRSALNAARTTVGIASTRQKEYFDRHAAENPFQVDDLVMRAKPSHNISSKFHYR
ncbi:unnamed protein product, partial [Dibothriocephalus latus]